MLPPFIPYIPLKHPDDLLPIPHTHRPESTQDVCAEWLADDMPTASAGRAISILSQLARWFNVLRFRMRRIEKETNC